MKQAQDGQHTPPGMLKRILAIASVTMILTLAGSVLAGAGFLGPGDEQLPGGEFYDQVTFAGNAGDELLLELTSTDFDPYLVIVDSGGNAITYQDDAAGMGLDVHLLFTLPATGQFTAVITSALPGESGAYTFSLSGAVQQAGNLPKPLKPAAEAPQANPVAGARTVSGTVLDTAGQPLPGARVLIVPAVTTGDVEVHTDSNGQYSVTDLPEVPYRIRAWTYLDYGGDQVCLRMGMESAADYDTFSPSLGAVKNFRWQLTGPIEDQRESRGTFGGTISLFNTWLFEDAGNSIEFAFSPTGPLIDGSAGEAFTRVIDPAADTYVRDVPVGPYSLEATLVEADGTRRPMLLSFSEYGDEPISALDVNWVGDGTCNLGNGWEWTNVYIWLP